MILNDIRAEIGPYKIIDLESITSRDNVDRSNDLKRSLSSKKLQFVKQTVINPPVMHTKSTEVIREIHAPHFDEDRLKDIIKAAVTEQLNVNSSNVTESVNKAITSGMNQVIDSLRDKISLAQPPKINDEINIDPTKLADMQQKAIERMSQDIDVNKMRQGKRIKIIDSKMSDLAGEL